MRRMYAETLAILREDGMDEEQRDFHSRYRNRHAKQAKAMLERTKLAASMEPIWHAARAELGEELEPLPAEVMDAVKTVRKRVAALRPP